MPESEGGEMKNTDVQISLIAITIMIGVLFILTVREIKSIKKQNKQILTEIENTNYRMNTLEFFKLPEVKNGNK